MQGDNHLVLYDANNKSHWSTGVRRHDIDGNQWAPRAYAILRDDGNFVIYDGNDKPMWETVTDGGRKGIYGSGRKLRKGN